jgi:hypothetical protein
MKRSYVIMPMTMGILVCTSIFAVANSKSDTAEAFAYSGCAYGQLIPIGDLKIVVNSGISVGLMYRLEDEGLALDSWPLTPTGRIGYEHLLESWTTAGALDSKWKALEAGYEKAMLSGIKKWKSGATLGVSSKAASAASLSKIYSLCRIAQIGVLEKAKKSKLNIRQYVIKAGGQYLPPLP